MPPPHLAVLNQQHSGEEPPRGRLAWLRASVTTSFEKPGDKALEKPGGKAGAGQAVVKSRLLRVPPLPGRAQPPAEKAVASPPAMAAANHPARLPALPRGGAAAEARAAQPAPAPQRSPRAPGHSLLARPARVINDALVETRQLGPGGPPVAAPRMLEPRPMAKPQQPRVPQEDLIAELPPAQAPLRITVAPLAFSTPVPRPVAPADGSRPPAAERAFAIGRQGARPAHAMSAIEIAAWREGAMEAGRARDGIFGRPRLWWWLALSLILVLPLAYAAGWLGLAGSGAEFLSTAVGQEAWIMVGGPDAVWLYWGLLFVVAMGLQFLRPLEPVLILCAASWWGWTGLHAAWVAGWLAQRIPPLPMPG